MTIDKAIEILTELHHDETAFENDDCYDAIKLGIEALKRIKEIRPFGDNPGVYNLPGETKPVYRGMTETMFINPERD